MTTVASGRAATIHSIAKQAPEAALLAAVIERAVNDVRAGDESALVWLRGADCLAIFVAIAPKGVDPRALQQRMLNRMGSES